MKTLRIISGALCVLFAILTIATPFISSFMQGKYKAQLGDDSQKTELLLEKKQAWANFGETYIFLYLFLCFAVCFLIILLLGWLLKK